MCSFVESGKNCVFSSRRFLFFFAPFGSRALCALASWLRNGQRCADASGRPAGRKEKVPNARRALGRKGVDVLDVTEQREDTIQFYEYKQKHTARRRHTTSRIQPCSHAAIHHRRPAIIGPVSHDRLIAHIQSPAYYTLHNMHLLLYLFACLCSPLGDFSFPLTEFCFGLFSNLGNDLSAQEHMIGALTSTSGALWH